MWQLVVGTVIGAVITLLVAHAYHRQASRQLTSLVSKLQAENRKLTDLVSELERWHLEHWKDLQVIRKHTAAGTIDDPEFPYK